MEKCNKYICVFGLAEEFLEEIVCNDPRLNESILKEHLRGDPEPADISDVNRRLISSLSNRNMMSAVIGFDKRKEKMREILFEYKPSKILAIYKNSEELLEKFKKEFHLKNVQGKRNLWRKFSEGVLSGSSFLVAFKNKEDLDTFIKTFTFNKYTKAALPMLLSKEIKGFGFALSCDFLKESGYRDYPKPDVHLIEIFYRLGLVESRDQYEVYKSIVEMADAVKKDAYTVDKTFWLISSGYFHRNEIKVGGRREEFIKSVKTNKLWK